MSESCIQIDELARVVALPEGDPGREHLDRCSRCRSLADMLLEFATPAEPPPGAGFDEVDDRLLTTIAELTGVAAPRTAGAMNAGTRGDSPAPRRRWWFEFPGLRLAGAFAALVIVSAIGIVLLRTPQAPPVMRAVPAPGAPAFVSQPVTEVSGGVVFHWSAVPQASAYRVVFLDEAMREIGHLEPTAGTSVQLELSALPPGLAHGRTIGWEVEALAGSDVLVTSPTRALRVP